MIGSAGRWVEPAFTVHLVDVNNILAFYSWDTFVQDFQRKIHGLPDLSGLGDLALR